MKLLCVNIQILSFKQHFHVLTFVLLILHTEIQRFLLNFDLALLGVKGLITVK